MTPAVAVLSELRHRGYTQFFWVGHKYNQAGSKSVSAEYQTVKRMGLPFYNLQAGKLNRNWQDGKWAALVNMLKVPWGFVQSLWIVLRVRPRIIVSFGGYLALPVVIVGKVLGSRVVTHEQTVVTGLTNKILPRFADKVLISWPGSAKYYPADKTVISGNPLRPEIFTSQSDLFNFNNNLPVVYVTGGNQGSHKINQAIFGQLSELLEFCNIIHQTGNSSLTKDADQANQLKLSLPPDLMPRYIPKTFIFETEIGEVFAKADLVVSRSGANTTYEILALGKPAIFIPIPWVTHNEQMLNAEVAAETGIGLVLEESRLNAINLKNTIILALDLHRQKKSFNDQPLAVAVANAKQVVKYDADKTIADIIEGLIK